ncbi:MAG TPA: DUF1697 domain-containing protein [Bauldia sp.]|nr:DUF1697 domain-containing protein [Bauldia sp.]
MLPARCGPPRATSCHVAFLRGIGPARKAPGEELRRSLGAAGFDPVVPVLASGNVVIGVKGKAPTPSAIEKILRDHFGYDIPVILRSEAEIEAMFERDPFAGIDPATHTRFVTMLAADNPKPAATTAKPPPGFEWRGAYANNVFFVHEEGKGKTTEMMAWLDRTFGKAITTRNWNTMEKIAAVLAR